MTQLISMAWLAVFIIGYLVFAQLDSDLSFWSRIVAGYCAAHSLIAIVVTGVYVSDTSVVIIRVFRISRFTLAEVREVSHVNYVPDYVTTFRKQESYSVMRNLRVSVGSRPASVFIAPAFVRSAGDRIVDQITQRRALSVPTHS
ncbi:hypothetical protein [Mycetocola sp. JXN-3]|uniref:hypothetical protein n=1 Tax=Mycetocola sp. JXN-3 TaxID=2116510 RepID=UPI00165D0E7C|nr:hypothetical protein [Mycetocola sp. JXN-3]